MAQGWWHEIVSGRRRGAIARLTRLALGFASVPYGWTVAVRNWLFDHGWRSMYQVGVPVVSVGNLTAGGTGKTPLVEYACRFYRDMRRRVAILSRGYGGRAANKNVRPTTLNDEAMVLAENLPGVPHLQDADRVAIARQAIVELDSEVLVLDDGFQHRRLHRDLDIMLIDATEPWGYGRLLPRGLLREPIGGLRRASLVVLTRCDQVSLAQLTELKAAINHRQRNLSVVESIHAPTRLVNVQGRSESLEILRHRPVLAFCGIGNPSAFAATLAKLAADVVGWKTFPDHHDYQPADLEHLQNWIREHGRDAVAVTTQKDLVKLRGLLALWHGRVARAGSTAETAVPRGALWAVQIALEPTANREVLDQMLRRVLE